MREQEKNGILQAEKAEPGKGTFQRREIAKTVNSAQ